jgi:hypothetical protein
VPELLSLLVASPMWRSDDKEERVKLIQRTRARHVARAVTAVMTLAGFWLAAGAPIRHG